MMYLVAVPSKYKDQERIWMYVEMLFPKAVKEGRLQVEIGAWGCSAILIAG